MNPYEPSGEPNVAATPSSENHVEWQASEQTPRVWTALAIPAVSFLFFLFISSASAVLGMYVVLGEFEAWMLEDRQSLQSLSYSIAGLAIVLAVPQIALMTPSWLAANASSVETHARLGTVRGNWPVWGWILASLATPLIGLISTLLVGAFVEESGHLESLSELFRWHGENGNLVFLVMLVGLTPAICEEVLFRGYVQTRLAGSLGPLAGILISSAMFAAFHLDPVHAIAVFPLGMYLGFVSWRSNSLYPAILGHLVNNTSSVLLVAYSDEPQSGTFDVPSAINSLGIIGLGIIGVIGVVYCSLNESYYPPTNPIRDEPPPPTLE